MITTHPTGTKKNRFTYYDKPRSNKTFRDLHIIISPSLQISSISECQTIYSTKHIVFCLQKSDNPTMCNAREHLTPTHHIREIVYIQRGARHAPRKQNPQRLLKLADIIRTDSRSVKTILGEIINFSGKIGKSLIVTKN